jgi:TPR repeat protein
LSRGHIRWSRLRKLGECYEEGFGVEASLTDAMKWYMIAFMNGLEEASKYIQLAMDKFESDEQSMLSGYLAKEWLREHFPTERKE